MGSWFKAARWRFGGIERAQETLAQVQAEFAHAARVSMLGGLTASITHEVNQPLSAIVTSAEAALRWLGRTSASFVRSPSGPKRTHSELRKSYAASGAWLRARNPNRCR
jgi:signal transduction histidine kinase